MLLRKRKKNTHFNSNTIKKKKKTKRPLRNIVGGHQKAVIVRNNLTVISIPRRILKGRPTRPVIFGRFFFSYIFVLLLLLSDIVERKHSNNNKENNHSPIPAATEEIMMADSVAAYHVALRSAIVGNILRDHTLTRRICPKIELYRFIAEMREMIFVTGVAAVRLESARVLHCRDLLIF